MKRPAAVLAACLACALLAAGPAVAAVEKKVLRMAFRTAEAGFDPQRIDDRYSVGVCENLFEPLLTYDYLARPVKLVPLVAEAVPEPEEGGTRYTFRLKPGILFADDPAFKGQKRELVAKDVEYAIKRFRDPKQPQPVRVALRAQAGRPGRARPRRPRSPGASTTTRGSPASRCATATR